MKPEASVSSAGIVFSRLGDLPFARWALLSAIAVGGSLAYGATLGLVLPGWTRNAAALWLTLSAGLAWGVFFPILCAVTKVAWRPGLDACLVTMAAGEIVLLCGAVANLALWREGGSESAAAMNGGIVATSNVVMLALLARRLSICGVAASRTILLWIIVLDGSGAVFFFLLRECLATR